MSVSLERPTTWAVSPEAFEHGGWVIAKQGTYGALGVAAALLVGLFLISRLMVAAAVVNATLWERRARAR